MTAPPSQVERWLRIALRTAHICAFSVYAGGVWFGAEELGRALFWAAASGAALAAVNIGRAPVWIVELRGVATLLKSLLIALAAHWSAVRIPLLASAMVLASVASHMPGRYRYYSVWHRRRTGAGP